MADLMLFLTSQPIDVQALAAFVHAPDRGGVVTFAGLVRDHHAGRRVLSLSYSAYEPMAEKVCGEIRREAESRWPATVAMTHRLGDLAIGDVAVAVVVAAGHRDVAFEACRWVIDELKRRVPIWKRERYADGTEAWVDPTAPQGIVEVMK
ncbi:MAG: molybdenum cofactor biosynthesis protein MoaE [Gemmatimonadota bacterium]